MTQNDDLETLYWIIKVILFGLTFYFVLNALIKTDYEELNETSNQNNDKYEPKVCQSNIPVEISERINQVNWIDYQTAYGNAEKIIPLYLKNLFCSDLEIVMDASDQLWWSLCHQHAYISNAALPAYDILKIGLIKLDDQIKIEILDIFKGFSYCTSEDYYKLIKDPIPIWEKSLKEKLIADKSLFETLTVHCNEEISSFAIEILADIKSEKYS